MRVIILAILAIAIVNKMEDPEEFYKSEIEKADKEFLDGLKGNQDRAESEKKYRDKLKNILEKYEKLFNKYLENQKKQIIETEKKKGTKKRVREKQEKFEVKSLDLKLSWKEKLRFKIDLFKFKTRIKMKDFLEDNVPFSFIFFYVKTKLSFRSYMMRFSNYISLLSSNFTSWILKIFEKIKSYSKKAYLLVKGIFVKVYKIFVKGKTKEKKKEKNAEEKIENSEENSEEDTSKKIN